MEVHFIVSPIRTETYCQANMHRTQLTLGQYLYNWGFFLLLHGIGCHCWFSCFSLHFKTAWGSESFHYLRTPVPFSFLNVFLGVYKTTAVPAANCLFPPSSYTHTQAHTHILVWTSGKSTEKALQLSIALSEIWKALLSVIVIDLSKLCPLLGKVRLVSPPPSPLHSFSSFRLRIQFAYWASRNYFQLPRAFEHEEHISWCL